VIGVGWAGLVGLSFVTVVVWLVAGTSVVTVVGKSKSTRLVVLAPVSYFICPHFIDPVVLFCQNIVTGNA
jgi:hypothetical protein